MLVIKNKTELFKVVDDLKELARYNDETIATIRLHGSFEEYAKPNQNVCSPLK